MILANLPPPKGPYYGLNYKLYVGFKKKKSPDFEKNFKFLKFFNILKNSYSNS